MSQEQEDMSDVGSEIFVVGDLRVDVGQQRVTRAGTPISLPNLSFQLFVALIRGAPNVQSHDALMERVWPGLVVSPETVIKRANLLREALGDDAREPRYIAGVRSRGYRLVAGVSRVPGPAPPAQAAPASVNAAPETQAVIPHDDSDRIAAASPASGEPSRRSLRRWFWVAAVAIILLAIPIALGVINVRRANLPAASEIQQAASLPAGTRASTVAVLPFENVSADATDAYLARGMPEMILNRLSHVPGLGVIARNSSFALATASIDSREIGRRLGAGFLISGSVQRKADRLRVTVQLADADAGTLIWSANLDRALSDVFEVEDDIADQVASELSTRVGGVAPRRVAAKRSENVEAYLAYLQGRALVGRMTVAESESAVPYFEKAIALDPNFAESYASLYDARMQAADQRHEDLAPARQRYRSLIDRALAIDPDSGAAYFARAIWAGETYAAREADFRRGAELDPSNGRGLTAYAEFLDYGDIERPNEATPMLQRALRVDPMSPRAHFHAAMRSGDKEGIAATEKNMRAILELDPAFVPALHQVALYDWIIHDRMAEAVQLLEHAIALDPGGYLPRHTAMAVYLDLGDAKAARAVAGNMRQSAYGRPLLALYVGDWRAAGLAAFDEANWIHDLECANWLIPEALRDYALRTGEVSRAIAFIREKFWLPTGFASELDLCQFQPALVISQLLAVQGKLQESQTLRQTVVAANDASIDKWKGGLRRIRAEALMLDGRQDEALAALAEDFRLGDHRQWWYTLKYDPVWLPLHGDPRFRAIAADVRRFIDYERNRLEELRRRGDVPDASRRVAARREEAR